MAERKNIQKYYPPEWEPKHGSLNKFHNSHPLRQRASKLKSEGILVIRFEIPYNMICGGCGKFIAQGERFNAEKKTVGNYFSTKILSFRMKCANCPNWFEIQTDPKNQTYLIISGGKKKATEFSAADAGTMSFLSVEERMRLKSDPLYALEHREEDKRKAQAQKGFMEKLMDYNEERKDTFDINELARQKYRQYRRDDKLRMKKGGVVHKEKLLAPSKEEEAIVRNAIFKSNSKTHQSSAISIFPNNLFKTTFPSSSSVADARAAKTLKDSLSLLTASLNSSTSSSSSSASSSSSSAFSSSSSLPFSPSPSSKKEDVHGGSGSSGNGDGGDDDEKKKTMKGLKTGSIDTSIWDCDDNNDDDESKGKEKDRNNGNEDHDIGGGNSDGMKKKKRKREKEPEENVFVCDGKSGACLAKRRKIND